MCSAEQEEPVDFKKVIEALLPFRPDVVEPFEPLAPTLRSMELDGVMVGRITHLLISAVIVPLLSRGEPAVPTLSALVEGLYERLHTGPRVTDQVVSSALADVKAACAAVDAVLNPMAKDASAKLQELSNARKGPLYVMRQTMRNVPYWKKLQAELERTAIASGSLLPLLDELTAKVKEGNEEKIAEAFRKRQFVHKIFVHNFCAP